MTRVCERLPSAYGFLLLSELVQVEDEVLFGERVLHFACDGLREDVFPSLGIGVEMSGSAHESHVVDNVVSA